MLMASASLVGHPNPMHTSVYSPFVRFSLFYHLSVPFISFQDHVLMCLTYNNCSINVSCFSSSPSPIPSLSSPSSLLSQYKAEELEGNCTGGLLLCNKLSQNQQLTTTHGHYFTVSVGQESRAGLAGFSALGSHQAEIWVLVGATVHQKLDWGKIHFQATSGCW